MVSLDESWFYLLSSFGYMWFRPGKEPPVRLKHTLEDRKVMVTIGFSVANFHVMLALPKDQKFNATYRINGILRRVLDSGLKTGASSSFMPTMPGRTGPNSPKFL
jgi:hypothetical protein